MSSNGLYVLDNYKTFSYKARQSEFRKKRDKVVSDELKSIVTLEIVRKNPHLSVWQCERIYNSKIDNLVNIKKMNSIRIAQLNLNKRNYERCLEFCHWAPYNLR